MATSVKPANNEKEGTPSTANANEANAQAGSTETNSETKDGVTVTTSEKNPEAQATVEATVAPKEVMKKVLCLQDHTCTIGNDNIIVEKGKDYSLREDIAYALQARQIVMVK